MATVSHTWQQLVTPGTIWSHLAPYFAPYTNCLSIGGWLEEKKEKDDLLTCGEFFSGERFKKPKKCSFLIHNSNI